MTRRPQRRMRPASGAPKVPHSRNSRAATASARAGGEALYADRGHFGRHAIRTDWFTLIMPALVLNYLGQGALVLSHPNAAANRFFLLVPDWLLIPLVGL